jgi:RNA recognition motif-containing protein
MNIFIGNMSKDTTSNELESKFLPYGTVNSCRIVIDVETGESRGYGFVEMPEALNGTCAINSLNNIELKGKKLSVHEARPKRINKSS